MPVVRVVPITNSLAGARRLASAEIRGVLEEVGNRSVAQLGKERDELLLGLLRLRSKLTKTLKTPRRSPAHPTDRRKIPGSRIKPS
jgi:hypothetical protein